MREHDLPSRHRAVALSCADRSFLDVFGVAS
jgi:hypothetical protein